MGRPGVIPEVPRLAREEEEMPAHVPLLADEEKREVLSVTRAARLLGKSSDTIYRWLNAGLLAGRKVGGRWLVYRDSVETQWAAEVVEQEER
jgi:excisionase family DNA binding protein